MVVLLFLLQGSNMTPSKGFTLVELSIVILIISLLAGGVIVGQSLLRSSELRAAVSESARYKQVIKEFQDKYMALPGDFAGATSIFGGSAGTCPATYAAPITSGTCNGDGDGLITVNSSSTRVDEQFLAWQHLAKAQMIEGSFTGATGSAGGARDRIPGTNVPQSKLKAAGWGLISVTLTDIAGGYTAVPYTAPDTPPNHVLWLGGRSASATADSVAHVLTTEEAIDIDSKIDNGLPASGMVVSQSVSLATSNCMDTGTTPTSYNAQSSGILCSLVFKTGY